VKRSAMILGGVSIASQEWLAFRSGAITYQNAYYQPVISLFAVGTGVTLLVASLLPQRWFDHCQLPQTNRRRNPTRSGQS
jgi:hypothetical protein